MNIIIEDFATFSSVAQWNKKIKKFKFSENNISHYFLIYFLYLFCRSVGRL